MENAMASTSPTIAQIIERVQREIKTLKDTAHVLTPMARTRIDYVAQGKIPVLRVASLSPDPGDYEVYPIKNLPGKFALTKVGLMRLEAMAGITDWHTKIEIIDKNPMKVKTTAHASVEDIDGMVRTKEASFVYDLTDDSPQAKKMKPEELSQARANIVQLAETKAMNRVRRDLLNLQPTFTQDELRKPFVIMRLVDAPLDASDPLVKKLLIMKQLKITSEMYESAAQGLCDVQTYNLIPEKVSVPATSIPAPPPAKEREALIASVEELYKKKVRGGRSPNKQPISEVATDELVELQKLLITRPDIA